MCDEQKMKNEKHTCFSRCRMLRCTDNIYPILSTEFTEYFSDAECTKLLLPNTPELNEAMAATIIQLSEFEAEVRAPISNCNSDDCECVPFEDPIFPPREVTDSVRRALVRKLNITGIDAWVKFTYAIRWSIAEGICIPKVS